MVSGVPPDQTATTAAPARPEATGTAVDGSAQMKQKDASAPRTEAAPKADTFKTDADIRDTDPQASGSQPAAEKDEDDILADALAELDMVIDGEAQPGHKEANGEEATEVEAQVPAEEVAPKAAAAEKSNTVQTTMEMLLPIV